MTVTMILRDAYEHYLVDTELNGWITNYNEDSDPGSNILTL
jgi:hypothetical protein